MVSDDENSQSATNDAFDVLYYIAGKRLKSGLLTVVDATNVQKESRKGLIELGRTYHCLPVAIVLDLPEKVCEERNQSRPDRNFGGHVIRQQNQQLKKSIRGLKDEGFRQIYILLLSVKFLINQPVDSSNPFNGAVLPLNKFKITLEINVK